MMGKARSGSEGKTWLYNSCTGTVNKPTITASPRMHGITEPCDKVVLMNNPVRAQTLIRTLSNVRPSEIQWFPGTAHWHISTRFDAKNHRSPTLLPVICHPVSTPS